MKKETGIKKVYGFVSKYVIFAFAFCVAAVNFSLIFDNVVWGDEAFSANIIRGTNFAGLFERVFYWENHPPLYYITIKIFGEIFGYKVTIYHAVSVLFFIGCIVIALTLFRKKLGNFPAAFFILISGLSSSCAEYNLEIRMYEECFFLVLLCAYSSYKIIEEYSKKRYWILFVISGVLSAYTHYYGLVTTGILLFITSVAVFIKHRKKTWLYGVISIASYILLYTPWLYVLYVQMKGVSGKWWMEAPDGLGNMLNYVFGGGDTKRIFEPVFLLFTVFFIMVQIGVIKVYPNRKSGFLAFGKAFSKKIDDEGITVTVMLLSSVLVIAFGYFMCAVYKPILTARYLYPIIPLLLTAFMIEVKCVYHALSAFKDGALKAVMVALFAIFLVLGLCDFKYFRSVTKTENVQTNMTLDTIGTPSGDAVFASIGVQHLAWTVLPFYYPDNEVVNCSPLEAEEKIGRKLDDIWFLGYRLSETEIEQMESRGYEVTDYADMQISKYRSNVYHFVR